MKYFSTVFVKDEWISFFSNNYDFFWIILLHTFETEINKITDTWVEYLLNIYMQITTTRNKYS